MGRTFILLTSVCLGLSACASITPVRISGPNGRAAYTMKCSGMGRTIEACYQKAGEVCPAGWTVVDRSTGTVGMPVNGGFMLAPRYSLTIECK